MAHVSRKSRLLATVAALTLLLAGCRSSVSVRSSQQVMADMQKAMSRLSSVTMHGALTMTSATNGTAASQTSQFTFDGGVNLQAYQASSFDLTAAITSTGGGNNTDMSLEIRRIDDKQYMKINQMGGNNGAAQAMGAMVNTWLEVPTANALMPMMPTTAAPATTKTNLTADQIEQLRALAEKTSFFKITKDDGAENIEGVTANHYHVTVDAAAVISFMDQSEKITGQVRTADEKQQTEKTLSGMADKEFELWIGTNNNFVYKIIIPAISVGDEKNHGTATFSGTITFKDHNKPVKVEKPADAKSIMNIMGIPSSANGNVRGTMPTIPPDVQKKLDQINSPEFQKQLQQMQQR